MPRATNNSWRVEMPSMPSCAQRRRWRSILKLIGRNQTSLNCSSKLPNNTGSRFLTSRVRLLRRRRQEQALDFAKRAVALAPKDASAHLALSICYGKLTDFVSVRTQVEYSTIIYNEAVEATRLDPSLDYAWHILGRWNYGVATLSGFTRGVVKLVYGGMPAASLERAKDCFEKAMKLRPDRLCHVVELGRTLAAMNKKTEARVLIERGLAMKDSERDDPETKERGRETLKAL